MNKCQSVKTKITTLIKHSPLSILLIVSETLNFNLTKFNISHPVPSWSKKSIGIWECRTILTKVAVEGWSKALKRHTKYPAQALKNWYWKCTLLPKALVLSRTKKCLQRNKTIQLNYISKLYSNRCNQYTMTMKTWRTRSLMMRQS